MVSIWKVPMDVLQELDLAQGIEQEAAQCRRFAKSYRDEAVRLEAKATRIRREARGGWMLRRRDIIAEMRMKGCTWPEIRKEVKLDKGSCAREFKRYEREHWKRLEDRSVATYLYRCLEAVSDQA